MLLVYLSFCIIITLFKNLFEALVYARVEKEAGNTFIKMNASVLAYHCYRTAHRFFKDWKTELTKLPEELAASVEGEKEEEKKELLKSREQQYCKEVEVTVSKAVQIILCNLFTCIKKIVEDHKKGVEDRKYKLKHEIIDKKKKKDDAGSESEKEKEEDREEELEDAELRKEQEKEFQEKVKKDAVLKGKKIKIGKLCEEGLEGVHEILKLPELDSKFKKKSLFHSCIFNFELNKLSEAKKDLESFKELNPSVEDLKKLNDLLGKV
jgi:hypothetical protein